MQSRRAAELVDDERLMRSPLAQFAQHAIGRDAFVHGRDGANQSRDRGVRSVRTNQRTRSFVCSTPTMLSSESAIDRQARVGALRHDADHLMQRRVHVERCNLGARHHQLARLSQIEPQRALQPAMFVGLEQPAIAALGNEQLDLVGRVDVAMRCERRAQQPQEQSAGAVEHDDEGPIDPERAQHRDQRVERRLRRILQRERLRHELPNTTCAVVSASSTTAAEVDWAASSCSPPSAANTGVSQTANVDCA